MKDLTHLLLFSGIDGIDLASSLTLDDITDSELFMEGYLLTNTITKQ